MLATFSTLALAATLGVAPRPAMSPIFYSSIAPDTTPTAATSPSFESVQAQDQAETQSNDRAIAQRGPLASPRDTARGKIGKAHLVVDYGQPSKRGREIFGGLVPYDQVWRTGANAATVLVTDKTITIGTLTLPAGRYTLYTIPSATSWQLIVNREVGQWGLTYHQEYDIGRVPMTVSGVKDPLEKFTIDFTKNTLRMRWDTTVAQVRITG